MKEGFVLKNHKTDIIIACVIILILTYFIPGPNILHYGVLFVLIMLSFPSLRRDESQYYENRPHDSEEPEREYVQEPNTERSAFSLRVDESQFWENRHHEEEEPKTDYSQVDPCFRGDGKKKL